MKRKIRNIALFPALTAVLAAAVLAGLGLGSVALGPREIADALMGRGGDTARIILNGLRLPRVLGAGLAGVGLSAAGLLLQSATDNGLCAPNVIGVNAGAGFAVLLLLCFAPAALRALPLAAFLGALGTTLIVLALSFSGVRRTSKSTMVLAGIAVSSVFNAGISFLSLRFPDALSSYASFSAGGFSGVKLESLALPALIVAAALIGAACIAPKLNLLCLGDDVAFSLGARVKALRLTALVLASAMCAAVVSYAGLLGFVGLVVPHMTRALCGNDLRRNLPASALMGAALVILADLLGRILFAPTELPAGILMALIGAPFFVFLLMKGRRAHA